MRVAFVGKGGAGKSAIAGTFARLLAARSEAVLAIDSDPMPGLAFSIGVEPSDAPIPDEAVEEAAEDDRRRYRLRAGLSAADAVERYATVGPDGIRVLQFGKLRGHVRQLARSTAAFHEIVANLPPDRWSLVGDLPAGTRQPFFGWARYARCLLVVVEPTAKSVLSGRRLAKLGLAEDAPRVVALANKVREPADADGISARTGLPLVGAVPWDEALGEAERLGRPVIDHAPGCPAVAAVESLVDRMQEAEASAR